MWNSLLKGEIFLTWESSAWWEIWMDKMESDNGAEKLSLMWCSPERGTQDGDWYLELFSIYKINPQLGFKSCDNRGGHFPGWVVGASVRWGSALLALRTEARAVLQLAESNKKMYQREVKGGKSVTMVEKGQPGKDTADKKGSCRDCWVSGGRKCLCCDVG